MDNGLLPELINAYGVSGSEQEVRAIIAKEMKKYVDEVSVDRFGNLICRKKGKAPRIMLASHMDEIGLIVRNIDKEGRIYISPVGGIEPMTLVGQKVGVITGKKSLSGVISTNEISNSFEIDELPKSSELFVDTGIDRKQLEKEGVKIGDYVTLQNSMYCNLASEDIISGKALDDRIGCFILIEVAKRLKKTKNDLYFVFTVQEEVGLYGAITSAYKIEPDYAIVVDVTNANDREDDPTKRIGHGPCITAKDAEMIGSKCINDWLREVARKKKIEVQTDVSDIGTTDALGISISRGGVPATVLSVPVRNLHTTVGIAHMKDIRGAITILEEFLKKPPRVCIV